MWRNIRRLQREHPQRVDITPHTFVLPEDLSAWQVARKERPGALWIYKPANSSCGRGIKLLRSSMDIAMENSLARRQGVVQRYLDRPLLLDGLKFDLRLYVVVTSYDPLKAYLNSEGFVRLATEKYSASPHSLGHRTMHLTNYSVNKHAEAYVKNCDVSDVAAAEVHDHDINTGEDEKSPPSSVGEEVEEWSSGGEEAPSSPSPSSGSASRSSKWSLRQLREHFAAGGLDYELVMRRTKDLVVKALVAVEPAIVASWRHGANFQGATSAQALRGIGPNQNCFEIYGFDVLVDEALRPWLLEVNICPSLSSSSPLDKRIKTRLVADALTLAGIRPFHHSFVNQAVKEERQSQRAGLQPKHKGLPTSHTMGSVGDCSICDLGEAEWTTILDAHDEFMRRGSFERIFPTKETLESYGDLFSVPRYANLVLAKWLQDGGEGCFEEGAKHPPPSWVPRLVDRRRH